MKINHTLRFVGPIATNMNIFKPIFYHQNEIIQIFNSQLWLLKVYDDIKDSFYFICDPTMPSIWWAKKENVETIVHIVPTKLGGYHICWSYR